MFFTGKGTHGRLENCDIRDNKLQGVYVTDGANPVIAGSECVRRVPQYPLFLSRHIR